LIIALTIIALIVATPTSISLYQYGAEKNHLPLIPYVPNVLGSAENLVNHGILGFNNGVSHASASSLPTNGKGLPVNPNNPNYIPNSVIISNNPKTKITDTTNPSDTSLPVTETKTETPTVTIIPSLSSISLCGREQIVYSYDKTDMKTGGIIRSFTAHAPNEILTIKLLNGTIISSLENHNVNGCFVAYDLPNQTEMSLVFSGDYNGTQTITTGLGNENTITCYPKWNQSIQYDNFGNIVQKFNPPIEHLTSCVIS